MQTVIVTFTPRAGQAEALIDALTRDFPRVGKEIADVLANRLFHLGNDEVINIVYFTSREAFKKAEPRFEEHLQRIAKHFMRARYELAQPVFSTPNFAQVTNEMAAVRFVMAETVENQFA
jgi:hypothetical protein